MFANQLYQFETLDLWVSLTDAKQFLCEFERNLHDQGLNEETWTLLNVLQFKFDKLAFLFTK